MSSLSQFAQSGKIKSIQRGVINLPDGSSSTSVTISSVDTTKSILYYLGQSSAYRDDVFNSPTSRSAYLTLTNSTTITASGALFNPSDCETLSVSWQLVEYY